MLAAKKTLLLLIALGFVAVAAAPHYHRTRPCVRCGLPERDYQFRTYSQPQRALSKDPLEFVAFDSGEGFGKATLLNDRTSATPGERRQQRVKSFQFVEQAKLQIDHCSIQQISVLLHESGRWTVSLLADQNPLPEQGRKVTTIEPIRKFTDHIQRNEFHVAVRCYSAFSGGPVDRLIGKPLVIPLNVQPFWVQRQQPNSMLQTGYHPRIEDYFESIDRVQIEFAIRVD